MCNSQANLLPPSHPFELNLQQRHPHVSVPGESGGGMPGISADGTIIEQFVHSSAAVPKDSRGRGGRA